MSSETAPDPASQPASILVLDDQQAIAEMLCEMLEVLGYQTTFALSGEKALSLMKENHYDVILSDFRMPHMSGEEFHQQVTERFPALADRIVFLTGDSVSEDTQFFLRATGNPHLHKPFQLPELESVVAAALKRKQSSTK